MEIEEQDKVEFIIDAQTSAAYFFEAVDLAGSTTSLAQLKMFVNNAPKQVRGEKEYFYLKGLLTGRSQHEVPSSQVPMPLEELENYIYDAPDSVRETKEYYFQLGLFDGRMMHEMNPMETRITKKQKSQV
ncbi:MAG: hypothetical protein GY729_19870 [Desulfobacteraceae bacterium]|nr:hypothetical protein [Desulfobacteraceae bacterium]